jgi:hypothetical protein
VEYVNKNTHDAFVQNNDGTLQRIVPGEVLNVDGAFADRLGSTPGVESASSADKKAWESRNDSPAAANVEPTPGSKLNDAIVQARAAASALLAATNQIVVGDDQAPFGPPSGTVTTVQAVKDPEHFGPLSAPHVGAVPDAGTAEGQIGGLAQASGAEVHNSQVEAHETVEPLAKALASLHAGGEPVDGDGDELADLTGDEIDAELQARDLPKTGKVEERRERLREAMASEDGDDDDSDSE